MTPAFWARRRVFVTGHTGFKGGWLSLWLAEHGAQVYGYALSPPTRPSFFEVCGVARRLALSTIGDVRDAAGLATAMRTARPEIVFHLAAQPLVRRSYGEPLETYATNVMGTVHLLEAARGAGTVRAVVNVTSDKCYENREWQRPYREDDPMGGSDPYSSSKGCAELVTAAYRRSFLAGAAIHTATARAGNVIGGGDWAADRLVPDFLRAIDAGEPLVVRSPRAVRPWQHVLEPLAGYVQLAERLHLDGAAYAEPWNFGPADADARTVAWVVDRLCRGVPGASWTALDAGGPHEAQELRLDSGKARARLGWLPKWDLDAAIERTLAWHRAWRAGGDMHGLSCEQIASYVAAVSA